MNYLKTKPYLHQEAAMDFSQNRDYFALFMEQGTGKSKTVIDIASRAYLAGEIDCVLLIAPNGVHAQWIKEQLPIHCGIPYEGFTWRSTSGKGYKTLFNKFIESKEMKIKWLAVNVEAFSYPSYMEVFSNYVKNNKCFVIIDECTSIKNPDAKRTTNIIRGLAECRYKGRTLAVCNPCAVKRAVLTGTPVTNSPYDLWAMGEFLKPDLFERSYYSFKAHYGLFKKVIIQQGGMRRELTLPLKSEDIDAIRKLDYSEAQRQFKVNMKDYDYIISHPDHDLAYKNLDELKHRLSQFAFFCRKEDCLDLPPKVYKQRVIELSAEQQAVYQMMENQLIAEYDGKVLTALNKMTMYTRLSQITGGFFPYQEESEEDDGLISVSSHIEAFKKNPKADALMEDLAAIDYPVLVTTRFVAEANYLYERIQKEFPLLRVGIYTGQKKTPADPVGLFKKGEIDVLIANVRMISKGHNLQNSTNIIVYSNDYSLENREQLEDRIHRNGQKGTCLYIDYIMEGTIDMKVYSALKHKKQLLHYIRDTNIKDFLTEVDDDMKEEYNWLN